MAKAVTKAIKNVVSKNSDDAVKAMRITNNIDPMIETLQKNVDGGMSIPDAVKGFLNEKDNVKHVPSRSTLISGMQNSIENGTSTYKAVNDYLDQSEFRKGVIDEIVGERRARQSAANKAYQSSGSGNKANRRAGGNPHNEDAKNAGLARNAIIKERRARQKAANEAYQSSGSGNRANARVGEINAKQERLANAIGHMRDQKLANEIADNYGRGQGNKAQRRIAEMRNSEGKRLERLIDDAADAEDLDEVLNLQSQLEAHNAKRANSGKTFQERKAERVQKNAQEQAIAQERRADRKIAGSYNSGASESVYGAGATVDPSAKNASAQKATLQDKLKANNTVYNIAAMGVGGGLVLNMFNNRGQQSNAQLYGQGY